MSQQDYIQDDRFKNIHIDPKFSNIQKKKLKVKIDDRFSSMMTDKKFQISQKYDKYGRKNEVSEVNQELQKYYEHEDEQEEDKKKDKIKGKKDKIKGKKDKIKDKKNVEKKDIKKGKKDNLKKDKLKKDKLKKDKLKGEIKKKIKLQQEDEESSDKSFQWSKESSSESQIDDEDEHQIDFWDEQDILEEEKLIKNEQSSTKLAMVNYDWQNISAQDIMTLFNSFIKAPSFIKQVKVYPSELGMEKMKIEQEKGPQNIWNDQAKQKKKPIEEQVNEWIVDQNDGNNALDAVKVRQYERERLKFYYAVIECDNSKTAEQIYNNCDGLEFELTSMKIDLRFVPEDQQFPFQPKEVCNKTNPNQKINNFLNRSLNHTNVKLTWDEPNLNRFDFVNDKLVKNQDEQKKIDWSQYIAEVSDDSQIVQDEEFEQENEDLESDDDPWGYDKKNRKKSLDMEITFNQGFEDIGNKIVEKQKQKNMTLWEKYQVKKKEKKEKYQEEQKMKKNRDEDQNDLDIKKYQAQLELLIDKKKSKKDIVLDVKDARFNQIYEKPEFAIDPTHKSYKQESSGKILQEQIIRRKQNRN